MTSRLPTARRASALAAALLTLGLVATQSAAATAAPAPPSPEELVALIDGRIPTLTGIDAAEASPDGSRLAVIAEVGSGGPGDTAGEQLWLLSTDGDDLSRLEATTDRRRGAGEDPESFDFSGLHWSPSGRYLNYLLHGSHQANTSSLALDLSTSLPAVVGRRWSVTRSLVTDDGRYLIVESPRDGAGATPVISVEDLNARVGLDALVHASSDPASSWVWSEACAVAKSRGIATTDPLAAVASQLSGPAPGCVFPPVGGWQPTPPTAEQLALATVIDGRIAGLAGLTQITPSPDGSKLAFVASISHPETISTEPAVWIMSTDGKWLVLVGELYAGGSAYSMSVGSPSWSADSRLLQVLRSGTVGFPRTRASTFDVSGETLTPHIAPGVMTADGRFQVTMNLGSPTAPYPSVVVTQILTGRSFTAVDGAPSSAGNGSIVGWTAWCRGAKEGNIPASLSSEVVAAQMNHPSPGCRLDPWPTDAVDEDQPNGAKDEPSKTTPVPPKPLVGDALPPAIVGAVQQPVMAAQSQGTAKAASPTTSIISARAVYQRGRLVAICVKVGLTGTAKLKAHAIIGAGPSARTIARASTTASGAEATLTLPVGAASARTLARTNATTLTLRLAAIDGADHSVVVERTVRLGRR